MNSRTTGYKLEKASGIFLVCITASVYGRSFDAISDEQISFVEHWINNLPRKIFNYRCSGFIFKSVLFDIAI